VSRRIHHAAGRFRRFCHEMTLVWPTLVKTRLMIGAVPSTASCAGRLLVEPAGLLTVTE
jgi:hypothetical protein